MTIIVLLACVAQAYAGVQVSQTRPQVRATGLKTTEKEQDMLRIQKKLSGIIPGVTGYIAPRPGAPPPKQEGPPAWNPYKDTKPPAVVRTIADQPELKVKDNWFKKWLREGAEPHHPMEGRRNAFAPPFEEIVPGRVMALPGAGGKSLSSASS